MRHSEELRDRRRSTYRMLIVIALAIAAGRIAVVTRDGLTAFLGANDRSRWCTVACLVERGTYAIDAQEAITVKHPVTKRNVRPWATIDKVRHTGSDGKLHHYSSKPPLFPTLVAAVYAVVHRVTGMTLTDQPMYVGRIVLAVVNLPLLALFFFATIDSIERLGGSDWARRVGAIAVCFGTMLLPFSVTLNNHLPAAAATAAVMWIYLYAAEKLDDTNHSESIGVPVWLWCGAGIAAAFAAANELPALSMLAFWGLLCFLLERRSVVPFSVGVAVVAIGFFGTNWIAHHSLRPPYAHRGNGDAIAILDSTSATLDEAIELEVANVLKSTGHVGAEDVGAEDVGAEDVGAEDELSMSASDEGDRWVVQAGGQLFALLRVEPSSGGATRWQLAEWDDWYEYPGTHWKPGNLRGVDRGEPSRLVYFAQMMIGHHGIFSLHPIWLLVPLGLIGGLRFGPPDFQRLVLATLVASVVCIVFYIQRPMIDRNYGGVSVCFRWLLWFAPLWLLVITPVMTRFSESKLRRGVLMGLIALSIFSMSTALASPWQHPWAYQFWAFLGWIDPS